MNDLSLPVQRTARGKKALLPKWRVPRWRVIVRRRQAGSSGCGEAGFTLLEMLVALSVFSLAALALVRLQAVAVRTVADLDERQMARIVAHNLMVDVQTSPAMPATGEEEGALENGGRQWRWVRKVSPAGEQGVLRIDLRVTDGAGGGSPAVLSFLKAER